MATGDQGAATKGQAYFNSGHTVLYPSNAIAPAPSAWPSPLIWEKFDSLACFEAANGNPTPSPMPTACPSGPVASNVQVVAYDNENWPSTPCQEWQDVDSNKKCAGSPDPNVIAQSMKAFANYAHAASPLDGRTYGVLFMPAFNLAGNTTKNYTDFINWGLAGNVASNGEFYHIQAQGLQATPTGSSPPSYQYVVRTIVGQIQASASPLPYITSGLSNYDPASDTTFTPSQILTAVTNSKSLVSGYWPNDVDPPATAAPNSGTLTWIEVMQTLSAYGSPQP